MLVRRASREEVERLNAIAMEAKAHWGYEPAQLEEWRPGLLTQPESIDRWPTFVAVVHGQAVGFAQANPERSPWELVSLWVLPAFMGRGIGKALLQHICRAAAAAQESSLDIDADPNAEPFYRACGAVTIGVAAAPIRGEPSRVRPQMRLHSNAASPMDQLPTMLHHLSLGAVDIERAARFYDAALAPLGYGRVWSDMRPGQSGQAVGYGPPGSGDKLAIKQVSQPIAPIPGFHVAFSAPSRASVAAFHAAALAAGGTDNGPPGLRPHCGARHFSAFVVDPEGHRLEAVYKGAEE